MKQIKRWLTCYLFPLAVLAMIGWLVFQQALFNQTIQDQNAVIDQLESQLKAFRTPKVIQDENKHYQQMAYLVLVDRSDLDLGAAYLEILSTNYKETKDRKRQQDIQVLKSQVDTLRAQVKDRTKLITELQSRLSKPGNQKKTKEKSWLRPLKGWVNVEYHEGKAGQVDPQQWRYWSTLEQARWYLVHGHYDDYLDAIANIESWVKLYPGDIDWQTSLTELAKPLQDLDLSSIHVEQNRKKDLEQKAMLRKQFNEKTKQKAQEDIDLESESEQTKSDSKPQQPRHGVIA
ncbi:MAG: hypothetical protein P8L77_03950 [Gammaproteobacteria bacterium]|nr:hypothetical protein [Gammaproteobacteria bacterium]